MYVQVKVGWEEAYQTKVVVVHIKPGLKDGSKIEHPGFGARLPDGTRQDLHCIVEYVSYSNWKPHVSRADY